jgi:tetratricopeptide (TPR) repeat protein
MKRLLFVLLVSAGFLTGLGNVQALTPFEEGNAAFKEGRMEEAESAYSRHLKQFADSTSLRFNLGKVRENLGDPGGAILEWERALRYDPRNKPARDAIAATRKITGAKVAPVAFWNELRPTVSIGYEGWIAAAGFWIFVGALMAVCVLRWKQTGLIVALCGVMLSTLGIAWWRDSVAEANTAIVKERTVTARSAPAESARPLGDWGAGSRVRILSESAGWERCILPDGIEAWLPAQMVERIVPVAKAP